MDSTAGSEFSFPFNSQGPGVPVVLAATGAPAPGVYARLAADRRAQEALSSLAASNTPAIATLPVLIDHLRATFPPTLDALERAKMQFGPGLEWVEMERGGFFFDRCLRRGHVSIYYDGKVETNQGMVLVEVSGQGCRQLESEGLLPVACEANGFLGGWRGFLDELQELGCTFPRVDFALDDTDGRLSLETIEAAWKAGNCASRFRSMEPHTKYTRNGDLVGHTLNFGDRTSQMFVRIYNKRLEQIVKGEEVPHAQWVRTEVEAKGKGAAALVGRFVAEGARVIVEALRHYLDFKVPGTDSNLSRRGTCPWWGGFLEWAEKVPVGIGTAARTLEGMAKALRRQWAAGVALLLEAESHGAQWFADLLEQGKSNLHCRHTGKMKSKYRTLLAAAAAAAAPTYLSGADLAAPCQTPSPLPSSWPALGSVESAYWEGEQSEDWHFSPFLAEETGNGFYKPGNGGMA
jgi:phage replication initiation protein